MSNGQITFMQTYVVIKYTFVQDFTDMRWTTFSHKYANSRQTFGSICRNQLCAELWPMHCPPCIVINKTLQYHNGFHSFIIQLKSLFMGPKSSVLIFTLTEWFATLPWKEHFKWSKVNPELLFFWTWPSNFFHSLFLCCFTSFSPEIVNPFSILLHFFFNPPLFSTFPTFPKCFYHSDPWSF